ANDVPVDDYDGAAVFTVDGGETETVDVGLASNRGSIGGTVTVPGGSGAGTLVLAVRTSTGQLAGAATAAGNGSYEVEGLLPGEYLVAFVDPWGELGSGFEYHDDTTNPGTATPVVVTAADVTTVDAGLGRRRPSLPNATAWRWVGTAVVDTYELLLAVLGLAVLASAVLPRLVHGRPISVPIVYVAVGMALFALPF